MGLIGLLIAVVALIFIFVFSYFSNSPAALTPEKSTEIINSSQEVMEKAEEKSKSEQNQIKNLDLP